MTIGCCSRRCCHSHTQPHGDILPVTSFLLGQSRSTQRQDRQYSEETTTRPSLHPKQPPQNPRTTCMYTRPKTSTQLDSIRLHSIRFDSIGLVNFQPQHAVCRWSSCCPHHDGKKKYTRLHLQQQHDTPRHDDDTHLRTYFYQFYSKKYSYHRLLSGK